MQISVRFIFNFELITLFSVIIHVWKAFSIFDLWLKKLFQVLFQT